MSRSKLSYSLRKFLRREKTRLRREISDPKESLRVIQEVIEKVMRARTHAPKKK